MMVRPTLALASLLAAMAAGGQTVGDYVQRTPPAYQHDNTLFNKHPGSLQTPCVQWAVPYALGKLKLLLILPADAAREGVELQERLSSDVTMITTKDHKTWGEPKTEFYSMVPAGDEITSLARLKLSPHNRYDAIVIGKFQWTAIPEEIRQLILSKVKGGAALVVVGPWDLEEGVVKALSASGLDGVRQSVPLASLPLDVDFEPLLPKSYAPRRIGPLEIRLGKLGGGTVACLEYHDMFYKNKSRIEGGGPWPYSVGLSTLALTPYLADDPLFYDYYFSILGKVLLAATGKDSGVQALAETQPKTVERANLPAKVVEFNLSAASRDGQEFQLYYELRDRRGQVVGRGEETRALGKTAVGFSPEIPALKQGLYMVDLWVRKAGKVFAWASAALTVTDAACLAGVKPDKECFTRDEPITGKVELKAPLGKGLALTVGLWDTYGRLVQTAAPDGAGRFGFEKIKCPLSRTYKILAQVKDNGTVVEDSEAWVGLPSSAIDDFQFVMWADGFNQRKSKTTMHQCKQYGVTGYYDLTTWVGEDLTRESADNLARNNLVANPYCYGLYGFCVAEKMDYPKFQCGKLQETTRNLTENVYPPKVNAYKRYGAMAYSICEENFIDKGDIQWDNPEAMRDYHAYLRGRYGDIGKLNAVWGSSFKDFDGIGKISFMEAKAGGKFTQWFEQERHKIDRFNGVHEQVCGKIRELDPGARVSLDCIEGMDFDWPRMSKVINCMTQCPLEQFNKGQGTLAGAYIGYYEGAIDEYSMRIPPWQYLFQGGTHMQWWPVSYAFTPDLSEPILAFKQFAEEMKDIDSGAGKLLLESRKRLDPILVLWSNESYFAGMLNPMDISWRDSMKRFDNLLRRVGLDYQTIDPEYVEDSLRFDADHRVLVLPNCQALSRRQAERVRAFAQDGGLVVADFMPATMDEYLRPYGGKAAGGVSSEPCTTCKGEGRIKGAVNQTCPKCGGVGKIVKGGGIVAKSVLEDVFDFGGKGVKACGKGYGVFYNRFPDNKEEWGAIRRMLTERGGVKADVALLDKLGNPRTDLRWYVFDNGPERLLGILPDRMVAEPPGQEVTVKLQGKAHVYDVRANRYLGYTDQVVIGVEPFTAKLLALCPERIEGLGLTLPKGVYRPGDVVDVRLALRPESLRDRVSVVRVEVKRQGEVVECFTKNVPVRGEAVYQLPLALNQAPGDYQVTAVEIVGGHVAEAGFKVEPPPAGTSFLGIF